VGRDRGGCEEIGGDGARAGAARGRQAEVQFSNGRGGGGGSLRALMHLEEDAAVIVHEDARLDGREAVLVELRLGSVQLKRELLVKCGNALVVGATREDT
jgi:hypothetical protein